MPRRIAFAPAVESLGARLLPSGSAIPLPDDVFAAPAAESGPVDDGGPVGGYTAAVMTPLSPTVIPGVPMAGD
jgi:hypothetical protein